MRNRYFYLMFGIGMVGWMVAMWLGPKRVAEQSTLLPLAILFFIILFGWAGTLETQLRTFGWTAPGARGTMWNPMPYQTIEIADLPKSPGLRKFNIYKLGGNHYLLTEGGGKDGGYAAIPADCDYLFEGERSQRIWNIAYRWYRETPDKEKGERDLRALPGPVYDALRNIPGWNPKAPVMFGWFPYFSFGAKTTHRDILELLELRNVENTKLKERITDYESALSNSATITSHLTESYAPLERRKKEKKAIIDMSRFKGDEEP